jgi:Xaa-Pro dipeptidase
VIPNTPALQQARVAHARAGLAALRERHDGRPLVLSSVGAVAWATGGLSSPIDRVAPSDPVWVVVDDDAVTLIVSSVEVERLESELDRRNFDARVVSAPWYEPGAHRAAVELLLGARAATCLSEGTLGTDVSEDLTAARLSLGAAEREVLAALAAAATTAVEAAAHSWRPGVTTDFDAAAEVSAGLERVGADAVCLIVGGDDRVRRFRHPLATGIRVDDLLMIVVVARSQGLHVALTRIAATHVDARLDDDLARCDEVHHAILAAAHVGATWGDVYATVGDAYSKVGAPQAWRGHFQGGPIGYAQREFELSPESSASPWWDVRIDESTAMAWNPSLAGGAKIEDTYVVESTGPILLTDSGAWPRRDGPGSAAALWVQ